ncbi:TonB-dependent receptor domain-containing protein [Castellaniella sp.]|uniref:TonB-dependent receptor domain-containing protein n=1 Tax=Castellaniella sp. TaxID=1955812 RepID=UPI002AFFE891|nr:TonB-dependent receptor [Castellaniella sp.]
MFFKHPGFAPDTVGPIIAAAVAATLSLTPPLSGAQTLPPPNSNDRIEGPPDTGESRDTAVTAEDESVNMLTPVRVHGLRDPDTQGHENVFNKNVTNLYVDRKELNRYQVTNPADLFKGMNGVYSMDSRNGASISPNIRGLSGEGRVPLTVDGTEQSVNVWLQVYGAGNRNYVDPALFRSIEVEKGPSLSRGIKSGIGGAVNVRTINPSDIIPDGDSLGLEVKLETSGNTIAPAVDANSYFGKDYRDIPGATLGSDYAVNIPQPVPRDRSGGDAMNFQDKSFMFAIAGRNDHTDALLAYSYRKRGNYFAGKNGADAYTDNDAYAKDTSAYFPNLTKLYHPGNEVLSTASKTETLLLKNRWYLPHDQQIGLSFMRTDLDFAETSTGQSIMMMGIAEELSKPSGQGLPGQLVAEYPRSNVRLDTWKIDYEWKPEGSRVVDLEAHLWMTKTDSERHQSGSGAYYIPRSGVLDAYQILKADWDTCRGPNWAMGLPSGAAGFTCFTNPALNPALGGTAPVEPDHDGRIFAGSAQWTSHDRKGFDFSNRFILDDRLRLTVGGELQHEKLDERVVNLDLTGGIGVGGAALAESTIKFGPRSGTRREWAATMNLEWRATDWLTLTAGARYNEYSAFDDGLAERRANQVAGSQITGQRTGMALEYGQLMSNAEVTQLNSLASARSTAAASVGPGDWDQLGNHNITTPAMAALQAAQAAFDTYIAAHGEGAASRYPIAGSGDQALYWKKKAVVPVVDGKVDASQSPFAGSGIDPSKTAANPQGKTGEFQEIIPIGTSTVYATPAAGQEWAPPERQYGHAWSPVFSATARITDTASIYARYAQMTRFPSIFEIASTSVGLGNTYYLGRGASKPERSTNWEIGYSQDLAPFLPDLRQADVRLSYFDTTIQDFIDRDAYLNVIQFDRKKTTGIEFQSRFDSGRFFGGLGATWRLTQELCDENYAYGLDPFYNRMPECMTGGFPDMLTATSLQPRYSINAELGTRLLQNRLELALRAVYHAKAENKELDALLNTPYGPSIWKENSMRQLYWHPVMLLDASAQWRATKNVTLSLGVTNLTDRYYLDPMAKIPAPGPGRTITVGMRAQF